MLSRLQTVAHLPNLLVEAAQATTETPRRMGDLQTMLADALAPIAADLERVRTTIEPQHERVRAIETAISVLDARVADLQDTLNALRSDVEDAAEHLPDPDAPGPLARARDTLMGG